MDAGLSVGSAVRFGAWSPVRPTKPERPQLISTAVIRRTQPPLRHPFVSSISRGRVGPSERLKTALEARRERKVKAAQEEYEVACR
jgi:hypothetical protein